MTRSPFVLVSLTAVLAFAVTTGSSLVVTAAGTAPAVVAGAQDNPIAMSEESITAGRSTYGRFCRSCHVTSGDGNGAAAPPGSMPANLIDDEWDHGDTDGEIFTVIKDGVPPDYNMDAWEGRITEDDMWNVINYLRDLASQ